MDSGPTTKVLFVCRANICRSPMAEAIFNALARDAGLEARAGSAGVAALVGEDMDAAARAALAEAGIYPGDHRARQADRTLVGGADLVLTMSARQRDLLRESSGRGSSPVIETLPAYASGRPGRDGIVDPHGRPAQFYRATCRELIEHVNSLVDKMAAAPHQARR